MKRRLHSPHHMELLRKFPTTSLDPTFAWRCSSRRVNQKKASWASSSSSSNNSKQSVCVNDDESSPIKKSQQVDLNTYLSKRRNTTGSISLTKIVDLKNTASGNTLKIAAHHSNQKICGESKTSRSTFGPLFSFASRYFPNHRRFRSLRDETIDSEQRKSRQFVRERMRLVEGVSFVRLSRSNEFDWYPLDVAMMMNNIPMIQLLIEHGADESPISQIDRFFLSKNLI